MSLALHDPGTKTRLKLLPGVVGAAHFTCARHEHRLWLERRWEPSLADPAPREGFLLAIGMNPSNAGADSDDLTVRKDQVWARMWGFTRMVKVNVGTYCWTQSTDLHRATVPLCHPDNLATILSFAGDAAKILVATGKPPAPLQAPARRLFAALRQHGLAMRCFGVTSEGWPRHTSRLAYATQEEAFS